MIRSLGPIVAGLLAGIGLGDDAPPPPPAKPAPTRAEVREALRVNAARTSALTARRPHMPTSLLPRALGAGKFLHVSQEYRRHIHTGVPVLCEVGGTFRRARRVRKVYTCQRCARPERFRAINDRPRFAHLCKRHWSRAEHRADYAEVTR